MSPPSRSPAGTGEGSAPREAWYLLISHGDAEVRSRVLPLADGAALGFGRHEESEVVLDHDAVSRRHAVVRCRGEVVEVEDLGSKNGTLVNGVAVAGTRRVTAGDVIGVGPATIVVATASTARRVRQVATVAELDDRLEAEVDRAQRYHRALGLVMLHVAGPPDAITACAEHLLGELRRMDLVAEYGTDELAILLPESDAAATEHVARRAALRESGAKISVGFASFPADAAHGGELLGVARARLRAARATRRDNMQGTAPLAILDQEAIVADPVMKQVFALARRAAPTTITVLVVGETGSGKEVVAEAIHRLSPRCDLAFVRLNCAALPETLVESELFGHEKGSFTGASSTKLGFFESASGGTLFLDEIGELPLGTQAKLLRVLAQRTIVRVGGTKELPVDVRLVCATNRDLEGEVARGRFREDLYFRISALVIPVPPLRDRRGEIGLLAAHFARELASELGQAPAVLAAETLRLLENYEWPGNVRELRNVMERALVLSGGGTLTPLHLPDRLREGPGGRREVTGERMAVPTGPGALLDVRQRIADVERETVTAALEAAGGNQSQAARQLGISRFALIRLLEKHDLKPRRKP
jgi:DNA-binding NtrC family response regulator